MLAIPAPETIQLIYLAFSQHQEMHPTAKFVDMGTGSGVFCWLLHRAGIPRDRLIAVDLPEDMKTQEFAHCYWDDIIRDAGYTPNEEDFLFIAWGYEEDTIEEEIWPPIQRYVDAGGCCVAILGDDGCTVSYAVMEGVPGWKTISKDAVVPSCEVFRSDYLTVSVKA